MQWYYSSDGRTQQGPVSEEDLAALAAKGALRPKTLVWHEGMADWEKYSRVFPGTARYAGFWIRLVAKLVDGILLLCGLAFVIGPLMEKVLGVPEVAGGDLDWVALCWGTLYSTLFVGALSATPGKMLFRLRVELPDGGRVGFGRAFARCLAEMLSAAIILLGYVMAGFDPEKRALHDRLAGTRVVRK
ncbi:MAG: RDD family protein [Thermodesulfobacteriota bacterium]